MIEDRLVLLVKVSDVGLAHVVKTIVQNDGIQCAVFDDHPSGVGLGLQDVRVMVLESDLEKARILLKKNDL